MTDTPAPNADATPSTPASPAEGPSTIPPAIPAINKGGRPRGTTGPKSNCTPKNRATVVTALKEGATIALASALIGVTDRTLRRWLAEDEKFSAECQVAQASAIVKVMPAMIKAANEGDTTAGKFVAEHHHMLNRDLAKWKPEAMTPEKVAAAISGINAVVLEFVPLEKLPAAQAIIAERFKELLATDRRDGDDGG